VTLVGPAVALANQRAHSRGIEEFEARGGHGHGFRYSYVDCYQATDVFGTRMQYQAQFGESEGNRHIGSHRVSLYEPRGAMVS
jgi:hypothetical protein